MAEENLRPAAAGSDFPAHVPAVFAGEDAFRWQAPMNYSGPLYAHRYFKIGYCSAGSGTVKTELETLDYHAGTVCVVPPFCFHTITREEGTAWQFLFIDAEGAAARLRPDSAEEQRRLLRIASRGPLRFGSQQYRGLYNLLHLVQDELEQRRELYLDSLYLMCAQLLVYIVRIQTEGTKDVSRRVMESAGSQIAPALAYINENYAQPLHVCEAADACHLSESHFRRVFEENMGMPPTEYLHHVRLHAACAYIVQGKLTMEEIAARVGYGNTSTFYRNFKQAFGISPFQWRKGRTVL